MIDRTFTRVPFGLFCRRSFRCILHQSECVNKNSRDISIDDENVKQATNVNSMFSYVGGVDERENAQQFLKFVENLDHRYRLGLSPILFQREALVTLENGRAIKLFPPWSALQANCDCWQRCQKSESWRPFLHIRPLIPTASADEKERLWREELESAQKSRQIAEKWCEELVQRNRKLKEQLKEAEAMALARAEEEAARAEEEAARAVEEAARAGEEKYYDAYAFLKDAVFYFSQSPPNLIQCSSKLWLGAAYAVKDYYLQLGVKTASHRSLRFFAYLAIVECSSTKSSSELTTGWHYGEQFHRYTYGEHFDITEFEERMSSVQSFVKQFSQIPKAPVRSEFLKLLGVNNKQIRIVKESGTTPLGEKKYPFNYIAY